MRMEKGYKRLRVSEWTQGKRVRKYEKMIKILKRGNRKQGRMWIRKIWGTTKERKRTCWGKRKKLTTTSKWYAGFLSVLKLNQKRKLCVFITWDLHLLILQIEVVDFLSTHSLYYCFRRDQLWWEWEVIRLPVHNKSRNSNWWSPMRSRRTDMKVKASQQGGFEAEPDQGETGNFLICLL